MAQAQDVLPSLVDRESTAVFSVPQGPWVNSKNLWALLVCGSSH